MLIKKEDIMKVIKSGKKPNINASIVVINKAGVCVNHC